MILLTARDIGLRVKERRRELGWSQETLAKAVGVTRWFIGDLESGKETAELGLTLKVLRALGFSLDVRVADNDPGEVGAEFDPAALRKRRADRLEGRRRQDGPEKR